MREKPPSFLGEISPLLKYIVSIYKKVFLFSRNLKIFSV